MAGNVYRTGLISLSEEQKKHIMEEIRAFYLDERGEEIGIIEQSQILDLFLDKLAPMVYNQALDDAKRWHGQQMENLEADYYLLYRE
ncbi:MAG: DUF2164 domain-containing protein [Lachnospiraceae bacterium]|nr:DUF2164 domain-containing protein [Lachnospiraceae bacterium]